MQALRQAPMASAAAATAAAAAPTLLCCPPLPRLARRPLLRSRMACVAALSSSRSRPCTLRVAPRRLQRPVCASTGTEEASTSSSSSSSSTAAAPGTEERLKSTLADLDALLGIQEEPVPGSEATMASSSAAAAADLEVLQSAVNAELQKLTAANGSGAGADKGAAATELERDMSDQMRKIVERAKRMTEDDGDADRLTQKAALQQEFEQLLNIFFTGEAAVDKADVKKLKESGVFGPLTFWVTEVRSLEEMGAPPGAASGVLIRGNLRTDRKKVFAALVDKTRELFGDKYAVLMVEDPEAALEGRGGGDEFGAGSSSSGSSGGPSSSGQSGPGGSASERAAAAAEPRVAFQLLPLADVTPPPTTGWKVAVAGILLLLLFACSVQLSLVANITKLPKETLEYFANPDSLNGAVDGLPPGLADWDPVPYLASAIPIAVSVVGVNFVHELGHRVAALIRRVKLGPTFFVPNLQIGSFGGITPLQSLVKDRGTLWDVAAAGPLAGVLASGALLLVGLSQSHGDGALPPELLVPVPTQLFQGSLLLGTVTRLALGADALSRADVSVSPLVIAGWCGLVTNALNLLPVGCLDGGRMVQSAFGVQALSLSAFFTYVGLGLGLLGSSLSLPFGLYVLICQRTAERYIQDSVSPVADAKRTATAVAVLTAVLVLLPMADEVASSVGIGAGGPIVF